MIRFCIRMWHKIRTMKYTRITPVFPLQTLCGHSLYISTYFSFLIDISTISIPKTVERN